FDSNKENSMGSTNSKVSVAPAKEDVNQEVVVTNPPSTPSLPKKNYDEEPLLKANPRRFVLFPIQYHD
ncbi:15108_t:CDS:1, partial [Acaulospora colombiana]